MAYAGYLIKLGGSSGTVLPLEFVKAESYDVESGRLTERIRQDVTGGRHRNTAEHTSTRIKFTTRAMTNTALATLNGLLITAMSDAEKREITLEYYDPETDTYKTADGYMPVVKYPIRKLEQNMVIYNPIEFEFIEY